MTTTAGYIDKGSRWRADASELAAKALQRLTYFLYDRSAHISVVDLHSRPQAESMLDVYHVTVPGTDVPEYRLIGRGEEPRIESRESAIATLADTMMRFSGPRSTAGLAFRDKHGDLLLFPLSLLVPSEQEVQTRLQRAQAMLAGSFAPTAPRGGARRRVRSPQRTRFQPYRRSVPSEYGRTGSREVCQLLTANAAERLGEWMCISNYRTGNIRIKKKSRPETAEWEALQPGQWLVDFERAKFVIRRSSRSSPWWVAQWNSEGVLGSEACHVPISAILINSPGHLSIALYDSHFHAVEYFNPSGKTRTNDVVALVLPLILARNDHTRPPEFIDESVDVQHDGTVEYPEYGITGSRGPQDKWCQTWVWFYAYVRAVLACGAEATLAWVKSLSPRDRFDTIQDFWESLLYNAPLPDYSAAIGSYCHGAYTRASIL
ncbi:Hypothetical protein UVM_LOCUS10 [uncultured virus]|nr:Hypothetical protein UVM_LOCUS10 [uncultured virus]